MRACRDVWHEDMFMTDADLERLLDRHFAGALSEAESRELESMLIAHADARRAFVERARSEMDLAQAFGRSLPKIPEFARRKPLRLLVASGAVAASVVLALTIWSQIESGGGSSATSGNRRVLADGVECALSEGARFLPEGEVSGRKQFFLETGMVSIQVAPGARGVLIRTPVGLLRDVGTEFSVTVEPGGATKTRVREGLLAFTPKDSPGDFVLSPMAGEVQLQDDGSLGIVLDREGVGQIRRLGADRFRTPEISGRLFPKDLLRTGTRGANALRFRLHNGIELLLGPNSQVEVTSLTEVRLFRGDIEIVPSGEAKLKVTPPDGAPREFAERALVRVERDQLTSIEAPPAWLTTYRSDASGQPLGTLLAEIDGREVPLALKWHRVNVEIKDRIARTVIDEAFTNSSKEPCEGVFTFPLPAGASVSGFAVSFGSELVEGEIVEAKRAREIYEDLLTDRKAPALLEWSQGNVFKMRVAGIGREKRIRLTYTEVLPIQDGKVSWRYPLVSELLQKNPLESLEIKAIVSSSKTIVDVRSLWHPARVQLTPHAASVEYSELSVVPSKDFELEYRCSPEEHPVSLLTHRRDDEGYFLIDLAVPVPPQRNLDQASRPRRFIVLLDTSSSMAGAKREAARVALESLLSSLGERDLVRVGFGDAAVEWVHADLAAPSPAMVDDVLERFRRRVPLGATDPERILSAAFEASGSDTEILFITDGMPTFPSRDSGKTLAKLHEAHAGRGRLHVIGVGSECDAILLEGLAGFGGTVRQVGDPSEAAVSVASVLDDLSSPGWQNVSFHFRRAAAAAIHPENLPFVRAGSRATILGRYDPRQPAQDAILEVRALNGSTPIRLEVPFNFPEAGIGNSFIPRLWAERHVASLRSYPSSEAIRQRIVALSEEFQFLTPLTTFLVIEDPADRQKFQIEKRLRRRDGESDFAAARDAASFDLRRAAETASKAWRRDWRRALVQGFQDFGRASLLADARPDSTWGTTYHLGFEKRQEILVQTAITGSDTDFDLLRQGPIIEDSINHEDAFLPVEGEKLRSLDLPLFDRRLQAGRGLFSPFDRESEGLRGGLDSDASDRVVDIPPGYFGFELTRGLGHHDARTLSPRPDLLARFFPAVEVPGLPPKPMVLPEVALILDRAASALGIPGSGPLVLNRSREVDSAALENATLTIGEKGWLLDLEDLQSKTIDRSYLFDGVRGRVDSRFGFTAVRPAVDGDLLSGRRGLVLETETTLEVLRRAVAIGPLRVLEKETIAEFRFDEKKMVCRFEKDSGRLMEVRKFHRGELIETLTFEPPISDANGALRWRSLRIDHPTGKTMVETASVSRIDHASAESRVSAAAKPAEAMLVLSWTPRSLSERRQRIADGAFDDTDLLVVLSQAVTMRDEKLAFALLDRLDTRNPMQARLLRIVALRSLESWDEAEESLWKLAEEISASDRKDKVAALHFLRSFAETDALRLRILDVISSADQGNPAREILLALDKVNLLGRLGRGDEASALLARLGETHPDNLTVLLRRATDADSCEDPVALLKSALLRNAGWTPRERDSVLQALASQLESRLDFLGLAEMSTAWLKEPQALRTPTASLSSLRSMLLLGRTTEFEAKIRAILASGAANRDEIGPLLAAWQIVMGGHGFQGPMELQRRFLGDVIAFAKNAILEPDAFPRLGELFSQESWAGLPEVEALRLLVVERVESEFDSLSLESLTQRMRWLARWHEGAPDRHARLSALRERLLNRVTSRLDWEAERYGYSFLAHGGDRLVKQRFLSTLVRSRGPESLVERARRDLIEFWIADSRHDIPAIDVFSEISKVTPDSWEGVWNRDAHTLAYRLGQLLRATNAFVARSVAKELQKDPAAESLGRRAFVDLSASHTRRAEERLATILDEVAENVEGAFQDTLRLEAVARRAGAQVRGQEDLARATMILKEELLREDRDVAVGFSPACRHSLLARHAATTAVALIAADPKIPNIEPLISVLETAAVDVVSRLPARSYLLAVRVLLDQRAEILRNLETWYGGGTTFQGREVGHVLAEALLDGDRLKEAESLLTNLESRGEADPSISLDLHHLRRMLGDAEGSTRALERYLASVSGRRLERLVNSLMHSSLRQSGSPPVVTGDDAMRVVAAWLRRSESKASSLHRWAALYRSSKDHRLVRGLVDMARGAPLESILQTLEAFASRIGDAIHDEASLDLLLTVSAERLRAADVGTGERTYLRYLRALTLRPALDSKGDRESFLEAFESVLGGSAPTGLTTSHALILGRVLGSFDAVENERARRLVLGQVKGLRDGVPMKTEAGTSLAVIHARLLQRYGKYGAAASVLEGALAERRQEDLCLPVSALPAFAIWMEILRLDGRHEESDRRIREDRSRPYRRSLALELLDLLCENYAAWVGRHEEIPSGEQREVYHRAVKEIRDVLLSPEFPAGRERPIWALRSVFHNAKLRGLGVEEGKDFLGFLERDLPRIFERANHRNAAKICDDLAHYLGRVVGPTPAFEFLIRQAEAMPECCAFLGLDAWNGFGWRMSDFRATVNEVPADLERRFLAIVLAEMRASFQGERWRERRVYDSDDHIFWSEKAEAFAEVVLSLVSGRPDDESLALKASNYLFDRLKMPEKALKVMEALAGRGALSVSGRTLYVDLLLRAKSPARALALLRGLVDVEPGEFAHRIRVLKALHMLQETESLSKETEAALEWLRANARNSWRDWSALGITASEAGLNDVAVTVLESAARMKVRTGIPMPVGDMELAKVYGALAHSASRLGRTQVAADAASAQMQVVARHHQGLANAKRLLVDVLSSASDLVAFDQRAEALAAKTERQSPILHSALAEAYERRGDPSAALRHWRTAVRLAPVNEAFHASLVAALDRMEARSEALEVLLSRAEQGLMRDTAAWKPIVERLLQSGKATDARRAASAPLEFAPGEASSFEQYGALLGLIGDSKHSFEVWSRRVVAEPKDLFASLLRVRALAGTGDLEAARRALSELKTLPFEEPKPEVERRAAALASELGL